MSSNINNSLVFHLEQEIAKFVLAHLPENLTDEQMMNILPSMDDEFVELAVIVHGSISEYEEKYRNEKAKEIKELIKHKHFEEASKMASDYFQKKLIA